MFLHDSVSASLPTCNLQRRMKGKKSLPIEKAAQCACEQRDGEIWRKSEDYHAQARSKQPGQKDRLSANSVTEFAPEQTRRELGEGEGGGDHASVDGYLGCVGGDVEGFDHVVDVGEDGHEGNWLADPT
jgi:hypothetical protein